MNRLDRRNKKIRNQATVGIAQPQRRGAAMVVGISLITVLLLVAGMFAFLALTQKNEPQLVVDSSKVSADDLLTSGKTNNELATDYRIILAGLERDGQLRDTAAAALDDKAQPVGDDVTAGTSSTVQTARLSQLQTDFIKEADRRLAKLDEAAGKAEKLLADQKTLTTKYINDETTVLTGLKAKAAAETSQEAFLRDRDELNKEYDNFRMAITQVDMLLWANGQRVLAEKANVLGGKLQERLNDASNHGTGIAHAQTLLNGYQTNKQTAKATNETMLKQLMTLRPNAFEANKAVLQSYLKNLSSAHDEIKKSSDASKEIILDIQKY